MPVLDERLFKSPAVALQQAKNAVVKMSRRAARNVNLAAPLLIKMDEDVVSAINVRENLIDRMEVEVSNYLIKMTDQELGDDESHAVTELLNFVTEFERIGDYGKKLLEYYAYRQNRPKDFSQQAMTELSGMYAEAHHAIVTALDGFINDDPDKAREVAPIAGKLRGLEVELRNRHIQRLDKQECDSETGLVYVDILGIIEHIGYHSNNVAKATISSCTAEHKAKA